MATTAKATTLIPILLKRLDEKYPNARYELDWKTPLDMLVATFVTVLALSLIAFAAIKATIGLRVSEEAEDAGLDIAEHGMYGYPEQFIPTPELEGYGALSSRPFESVAPAPTSQEVPA